jgi:hypothetical protein
MTYKIHKVQGYLLVVDDSVHPYDSSKVGNPLAHLPLNGSPILEGVPLLPPIKDDVEELAEINYPVIMSPNGRTLAGGIYNIDLNYSERSAYKKGYNKAREKYKYTEEDVIRIVEKSRETGLTAEYLMLSSQYPTEFETEDVLTPSQIFYPNDVPYSSPKTITTAQGVQWVGKYK